jgi:two-component system chemotaxis response regulator CheB
MTAVRVMVVDDAAAVRQLLIRVLEEEPGVTVVGTAANGVEALERLPRLQPDILVLDVEMPNMGGLELLRELRKTNAQLPVLLFSSLTERGAMVTIEALLLGANDYVTKPSMTGSAGAARACIKDTVVPRLLALLRPRQVSGPAPALPVPPAGRPAQPVDVVVIAVSTGGPNALGELLPALPVNLPVPVLIVQHMPAFFTRALAQRLDQVSGLRVAECDGETVLEAGQVWLARGGTHLVVRKRGDEVRLAVSDAAAENFCKPSADVLFRSATEVFGGRLLGVVLTGMGHDGLQGCRLIREAGGQVIVQDRSSSIVWGMPGSVADAGLAHDVVPLQRMAAEIVRRVAFTRSWFLPREQFHAESEQ